jgi:hypothetical protein
VVPRTALGLRCRLHRLPVPRDARLGDVERGGLEVDVRPPRSGDLAAPQSGQGKVPGGFEPVGECGINLRAARQVRALADAFEFVPPGLVPAALWRPDLPSYVAPGNRPQRAPALAGVGRQDSETRLPGMSRPSLPPRMTTARVLYGARAESCFRRSMPPYDVGAPTAPCKRRASTALVLGGRSARPERRFGAATPDIRRNVPCPCPRRMRWRSSPARSGWTRTSWPSTYWRFTPHRTRPGRSGLRRAPV